MITYFLKYIYFRLKIFYFFFRRKFFVCVKKKNLKANYFNFKQLI
jgi:hypothetical protein